jgi:hypothetical protein
MESCHYNAHLFIYGMRDVTAFVIKGDTAVVMYVSLYLHNQRCIVGTCVSLFYRSGCVSDINLTEMRRKEDCLLFTLDQASSANR